MSAPKLSSIRPELSLPLRSVEGKLREALGTKGCYYAVVFTTRFSAFILVELTVLR